MKPTKIRSSRGLGIRHTKNFLGSTQHKHRFSLSTRTHIETKCHTFSLAHGVPRQTVVQWVHVLIRGNKCNWHYTAMPACLLEVASQTKHIIYLHVAAPASVSRLLSPQWRHVRATPNRQSSAERSNGPELDGSNAADALAREDCLLMLPESETQEDFSRLPIAATHILNFKDARAANLSAP